MHSQVDPARHYKQRGELYSATLPDGGIALLDAKRFVFHGSNAVGKRIWELLAQPHTRDEIVATLQNEFEVDSLRCKNEVDEFFIKLLDQKLVEPCDS